MGEGLGEETRGFSFCLFLVLPWERWSLLILPPSPGRHNSRGFSGEVGLGLGGPGTSFFPRLVLSWPENL